MAASLNTSLFTPFLELARDRSVTADQFSKLMGTVSDDYRALLGACPTLFEMQGPWPDACSLADGTAAPPPPPRVKRPRVAAEGGGGDEEAQPGDGDAWCSGIPTQPSKKAGYPWGWPMHMCCASSGCGNRRRGSGRFCHNHGGSRAHDVYAAASSL